MILKVAMSEVASETVPTPDFGVGVGLIASELDGKSWRLKNIRCNAR